ncbi:Serine/threonine-protein kinase-like protein [Dichotomopilus funicola]|uniref:non-specific serine/threonine protein kinase n=1 Tax=Dichotomopilus funicola TaxID=1934379 RepID=A0AAN6ZQC8_9PEZI|nr:Serine/threonine-protein kinase-like protein [Dichotomopilus funicola]
MGGVNSNLFTFILVWHHTGAEFKAKLDERQRATLNLNPRLAPTVLCEPGAISSFRVQTRIHTGGFPKTKPKWQGGELFALGRSGEVYKSRDIYTGDLMAEKFLRGPTGEMEYPGWRLRLKGEIEILARSTHPHIVEFLEYFEADVGCSIFMALQEGSLASLSFPNPQLDSRVCQLFIKHTLLALQYLAANDIIHRDVKPDNILYTMRNGAPHFQLADFGSSMYQADRDDYCGTPVYAALEIYYRMKQTPKADIWSLFVTIAEVLNAVWEVACSPGLTNIQDMAHGQAEERPSAAELLNRLADQLEGDPYTPEVEMMDMVSTFSS